MTDLVDLLVVGGGINGTGIARDAAGRGMSVLLCDQGDLAGATSSASSKLIHGGLRYLEHYEFRLVREALGEREILLRTAPHIIWPLRFVLPYDAGMRPFWLLRAGLFLYDHLGGRNTLPKTRVVRLTDDAVGRPLVARVRTGFIYSDCWVDDARLVVLNAIGAAQMGAVIATRTECLAARREGGLWQATLAGVAGGTVEIRARALVNAAGPWVAGMRDRTPVGGPARSIRLVKGSHIVVPRLYDGDQAYTFQIGDGRVVFVIPYEGLYSLIGTTDLDFEGDPARPMATEAEIAYLCGAVDGYFKRGPRPAEVVWSFAGVRPLIDDGKADVSAVSRDYTLDLDAPVGQAPALTVYGGKITTFRRLAEEALSRLLPLLGRQHAAWTAGAHLPGGDIADADFGRFLTECGRRFAFVPADMLARMAHAYGTRLDLILADKHRLGELGRRFGDLLSEAELDYLCREEWARNAEDVLWRRSKLGLHLSVAAQSEVAAWFGAR
jgi:glycerol-3-phosphate dehydrogenase